MGRNFDRETGALACFARRHLRAHRPLVRGLVEHLGELGRPRDEIEHLRCGTRAAQCLLRAEAAVERGSLPLTHALLVHGLECLVQLMCRRGIAMAEALGGRIAVFEGRGRGHEELAMTGLELFDGLEHDALEVVLGELEMLFADAFGLLDEWRDTDPPQPPPGRVRRRTSRWGVGPAPDGAA